MLIFSRFANAIDCKCDFDRRQFLRERLVVEDSMLKTVEAIYKNKRFIISKKREYPKEGSNVLIILEANKKEKDNTKKIEKKSLYGIWSKKFPRTFNVENELREIRLGWKKHLEN